MLAAAAELGLTAAHTHFKLLHCAALVHRLGQVRVARRRRIAVSDRPVRLVHMVLVAAASRSALTATINVLHATLHSSAWREPLPDLVPVRRIHQYYIRTSDTYHGLAPHVAVFSFIFCVCAGRIHLLTPRGVRSASLSLLLLAFRASVLAEPSQQCANALASPTQVCVSFNCVLQLCRVETALLLARCIPPRSVASLPCLYI
ncbi:hypothetical protein EXIGLDRAFT_504247 [Exidia glandulosa HHB12029]|uniref:Uncharacterized protein n=1 Tax=Exidia glandulosa HHB12029 TaxID=1314781 RepID=A0A166N5J9_EXIGL|nr:hypothetical protein EXIGLDRAFT_504247 [Exidia glandulosa HHB12029]